VSTSAAAEPQSASAARPDRWQQAAVPFAVALLVLAASFANFLHYHSYPLLRPEVLTVLAGLAAAALLFGLLHGGASQFGKALLDGLLAFLAVNLNSDSVIAAGVAALVFAFARLARNISLHPILAIVSTVVLASGLTGLSERREAITTVKQPRPPARQAKAVLHIILDEHGGTGGASGAAFRQQLTDFYVRRGFRLFDRAYSRHFHTVNAIPDVLNFGNAGESRNVDESLDIGPTAYLSRLPRQGYRLHIYQSEFADYCRYSAEATCTNYWSPSMAFLADEPMPPAAKARLLAFKFTALSSLALTVANGFDRITHLPWTRPLGLPVIAPKERAVSSSLGGLAILDRMAADLRRAQAGDAYFAHVLAPHFPYVADGNCRILPPGGWQYRRSARPVEAREAAYRQQVGCVMRKLDRVIAAFEASAAGRNAVIIVHGDHGSRIARRDPIEADADELSPGDLMAGYSTLFAVRGPSLAAGIEPRPFATPSILWQLVNSNFQSVEGIRPGNGQVHLEGPEWTVGKPFSIAKAWPAAN
jgi:hypothetical protein